MPLINEAYWAAKQRCSEQIRELQEQIQTRALQPETFETLEALLQQANDLFKDSETKHSHINWKEATDGFNHLDAQLMMSPISGRTNPIAPPLVVNLDDENSVVHAEVTMGWRYEGPPGCVHGGWIAALFDELMGLTQLKAKNPGMTGELKVRYERPTPLAQALTFEAQVAKTDGRKTFVTAVIKHQDQITARCEAVFIRPRQSPTATLKEQQTSEKP